MQADKVQFTVAPAASGSEESGQDATQDRKSAAMSTPSTALGGLKELGQRGNAQVRGYLTSHFADRKDGILTLADGQRIKLDKDVLGSGDSGKVVSGTLLDDGTQVVAKKYHPTTHKSVSDAQAELAAGKVEHSVPFGSVQDAEHESKMLAEQKDNPHAPVLVGIGHVQRDDKITSIVVTRRLYGVDAREKLKQLGDPSLSSAEDARTGVKEIGKTAIEMLMPLDEHVHGDPEPENIFLENSGGSKLLDWVTARRREELLGVQAHIPLASRMPLSIDRDILSTMFRQKLVAALRAHPETPEIASDIAALERIGTNIRRDTRQHGSSVSLARHLEDPYFTS
jgi:serine/threonine protein kinase